MGDDKDWQKQLMTAALMAATKTAVQYITHPDSRDETIEDVRSKLAEVDYGSAAKAVSEVIDRVAESAKAALNDAIDSIRENAEDAVEMAAERAQEQLGSNRKRGKGRMLLGILLGVALGFVLLNEDRRNQLMDKVTGASGPIDSSQWSTVASGDRGTGTDISNAGGNGASEPAVVESPPPPAETPAPAAEATEAVVGDASVETGNSPSETSTSKSSSRKAKASDESKSDA